MKLLKYTLMSILLIGSTGTFTSCKKDPCKDKNCENGGSCADGTCVCASGYEGEECKTQVRSKFLSSYNVSESCQSGNFSYQITITTSSLGVDRVLIGNFGGYGASVVVNASASGSSLSIPSQQVDVTGTSVTFSGSGQLSGNILTLTYTASAQGSSDNCTMTCTKV